MTINRDFYTLKEVGELLSLSYTTVSALVRADILLKYGRGQSARIDGDSYRALRDWIKEGNDLWDAPTMRSPRPDPDELQVTAPSGKTKTGNGGRHSASKKDNAPINLVLRMNKTLK